MKKIIMLLFLLAAISAGAQKPHKYFFFGVQTTVKNEVQLEGHYAETDAILLDKFEVNKRGDTSFTYKKFSDYPAAFNALAALGFEFVGFERLPVAGHATSADIIDVVILWVIFRKTLPD